MSVMDEFEVFSDRRGFNRSLGHFKAVNEIVADLGDGYNLADLVNARLNAGTLESNQIAPIVSALIVDKYGYVFKSQNMPETFPIAHLAEAVGGWAAADLVIAYHHPEVGLQLINPKNKETVSRIGELKKFELITIYAGFGLVTPEKKQQKGNTELLSQIIEKMFEIIKGKKLKPPAAFTQGGFKFKPFKAAAPNLPKASKAPASPKTKAASAKKVSSQKPTVPDVDIDATKLTGKPSAPAAAAPAPVTSAPATVGGRMNKVGPFGVVVSNELFHNGNVEAWKRIIHSYSNKYPNYQVFVYYDGEVIHDLNSLFKWGKVKHGTAILVAISGPDEQIKDVSKLRKYLTEGASPRFEQFLRGLPGKDLGLF